MIRTALDRFHDRRTQSPNPALAVVGVVVAFIRGWRERRRAWCRLSAMSDRELQDMGICRSDIANEIDKPFWRT
jgi:uncharacterized protein YjiS (DUF1127 family)